MSKTANLKSLGIDQFSVAQRILLAEEIWDSKPDASDDFVLTDAQKQDLERRLDARDANPNSGSSWETVKARLHGQL